MIAAAPPPPDPYLIYANARAFWEAQRYPSAVNYTVVVTVNDGGVLKQDHYTSRYDALTNTVRVDPISAEEHAHPYVPKGVNARLSIGICMGGCAVISRPLNNPQQPPDYLGVPELTPNYNFGIEPYLAPQTDDPMKLVAEIRAEFHDPMPQRTAQNLAEHQPLKIIGDVRAISRTYVITYDGVESIAGASAYHLSLRPTRDPKRFRLRELWVDVRDYATLQLVSSGNFRDDGPWSIAPWTVTFKRVRGAQYLAAERAQIPLLVAGVKYRDVTIEFDDIDTAATASFALPATFVAPRELLEPIDR